MFAALAREQNECGFSSHFVDGDQHFAIGILSHRLVTAAAANNNFRKMNAHFSLNSLFSLGAVKNRCCQIAVIDISTLGRAFFQWYGTGLQAFDFILQMRGK